MLKNSCLGVILAGGLSSRMGENKADLMRKQDNMLSFSRQLLADCAISDIVISGDNYDVPDKYKQLGPLSGIYSVIETKQPNALLILPVDLPLMTATALNKLKMLGELAGKATFYQQNYLPMYLPINAFSELFFKKQFSHLLEKTSAKGPSMRQFISAIAHQEIPLDNNNQQALFNCNTPEQWQQAKKVFTSF